MIGRFPVAAILTLVLSALSFCLVHWSSSQEVMLWNWLFATILTFFLSIAVGLKRETIEWGKEKKENKNLIFQAISLVFLPLFYLRFEWKSWENPNFHVFWMLLICVLSIFFIAPYVVKLKKAEKLENGDLNEPYSQYILKLAGVIVFGFILWGISTGLGCLAIGAVEMLFDISVWDSYAHWAIFALTLFTPLVCLTKIPQKNQEIDPKFSVNWFVSFVIKYVLLPFICIYFVILYVYSVNVLLHFNQRPQGEVSWLVIVFSIFGFLTYILSYFFREIKIVNWIRKVFPFIVVPQLFMLFYAIYLRIAQYDLTINRYLVVIFGTWLLVISLYYVFSRQKYLLFIPASLACFSLVFSFWPWWVFNLPIERQLNILENNLKKAEMLVNGEVVPMKGQIDRTLWNEIYDEIRYVCKFNCVKLERVLGDGFMTGEMDSAYKIAEYLNIEYDYSRNRDPDGYVQRWHIYHLGSRFPMDTSGYDFAIYAVVEDGFLVVTDEDKGVITKQENIDLSDIKTELLWKINLWIRDNKLSKEDLIFYMTGENFDVKLIIDTWDINNWNAEWLGYADYLDGVALVKRK